MDLLPFAQWVGLALSPILILILYIRWNDQALTSIPTSAMYFAPRRCTVEDVQTTAKRLARSPPLSRNENVPPRTGRRYIVVGGGGFLGGWIVTKLLQRGEEPSRIRLLDINPPTNYEVKAGLSKGMEYIKVDVSDAAALEAAFTAPWPSPPNAAEPEITVFHTAANIRFYERHEEFLERSVRINVAGTQNVIAAARAAGATALLYTSSGSIGVHATRFLRWPWEPEPARFVQVINDDDARLPTRHEQFFSNYAVTKRTAERLVRAANGTPTGSGRGVLRTGCIRPGNGVFGPRGDMLCGAYLVRRKNPTWIASVVQSFCYVENCAAAHLCYEAALLALQAGAAHPDIGGQAFCVADPGPTPTYGDVYTTLETLTQGECHFPTFSPTAMLLLAHVIEWYYRAHNALVARGWGWLAALVPAVEGDIINLQPSLFSLTSVHLVFDDARARLPLEKGGLGYSGAWTTLEGLHKTVEEHKSGIGRSETRSDTAGVSFSFWPRFLKRNKGKASTTLADKVNEVIPVVTPVEVDLPAS